MNISAGPGRGRPRVPAHDRRRRLPALRRRQGHRRRRGQARGPHPHRRRDAVGQVPRRPARRPARTTACRCRSPTSPPATVTQFTNTLEPDARSREVFTFHRPEELIRLVELDAAGADAAAADAAARTPAGSGAVQIEAIQNLEKSLADNRPRSLIQMATGSGKTFTAVNFCYRLIKFAGAKRILFLVDRNNLGKQTLNEFQQFVSPYNGYKFTEEYTVQHLKREHHRPGRQGLHHHDPAALLDAQGRGGLRRGERGRLAVRDRDVADQGAAAGRLQPEDPHRDVRLHRGR